MYYVGVGHKMWLLEPCADGEEGSVFRGLVAYTDLHETDPKLIKLLKLLKLQIADLNICRWQGVSDGKL